MGNAADQSQIKSSTGNAVVKKQGHTTNGQFGTDPAFKGKVHRSVRDLSAKK